MGFLSTSLPAATLRDLAFYLFAAVAVGSAIAVITARHAVTCALYLVLTLCGVAGLFLLLDASFLAIVQILVYAGAIMVLFLFVIMLLNLGQPEGGRPRNVAIKFVGVLLAGVLSLMGLWIYGRIAPPHEAPLVEGFGYTEQVGTLLFTKYLLPFEIASLLLLAAIVGVVILAKREF